MMFTAGCKTKGLLIVAVTVLLTFALFPVCCADWSISDDWLTDYTGPVVNVVFTVGSGGVLWVNGSSVMDGVTVSYPNATTLLLTATPTNANYSFNSFSLNGTLSYSNPVNFLLVDSVDVSNQTVTAVFVAEAVPALSSDDAVGVAFLLVIVFLVISIGFVLVSKNGDVKS